MFFNKELPKIELLNLVQILRQNQKAQTLNKLCVADMTSAKVYNLKLSANAVLLMILQQNVYNGVFLSKKTDAVVVNFCELFEGFLRGYP